MNQSFRVKEIIQETLPDVQRLAAASPLPRMIPDNQPWLRFDEAYTAQIEEKARLLAERKRDVIAVFEDAKPAVAELYDHILDAVLQRKDFLKIGNKVRCPDGRFVELEPDRPFETLAGIVQEDLCILQKRGSEYVLTAALLAFPAGWTLSEKMGRPLARIHGLVEPFDANISSRVQRFFDGVRPGFSLWRANMVNYELADLFQPYREADLRPVGLPDSPYIRSERQTVFRLPHTGAVVFAIKTVVVRAQFSD